MWTHEHTAETAASPEAVWWGLRDLDQWGSWDTSLEWVRLQGPFQAGSKVTMKPQGQDPITSVIVQATENRMYADETSMGEVTLRFSHTLKPLEGGGTRVTHRLEITGPAADDVGPELGPAITEDFPEAMAALLARAASTQTRS
jgi:Polyketide cyclase / dehydrase and lipid transport